MEKKLFKITISASSKEEAEKIAHTHNIEEVLYTEEVTRIYTVLTTKYFNEGICSERPKE